MEYWNCRARYADGFEIERNMPYTANGNYVKENEEQCEYEEYLLSAHNGCTWYSVTYVEDDT